ncbi:hypothetical protein [Dyadobacter sp. MSC1_007]|jgi:hypothetical protein|uniref:hypothetical protein n=1 Tax=Dyadobacter sp. MSC1_007 TaxID=2909264 RepID=UPI00202DB7C5|nr:hypothetical protein [Dyadobacter sp. MSC1_007]
MGAVTVFEESIVDQSNDNDDLLLEVGYSNATRKGAIGSLLYLRLDGKQYFLGDEDGRKLFKAVKRVGEYLGYDK